ncbi:hypothetical protein KDA14_03030, partial [Candidatus Saccharibacteria bacterium]|nr:hypothetical protein [Candidatus Saccharibacteria bacterium]
MSIVTIEPGRPMKPFVEAVVGETHVAKWIELDGRIAAVRRTLSAAVGFNLRGGQSTPYLVGGFAAFGQDEALTGWLNLDSMLVVDSEEGSTSFQRTVFVRTGRQLF